MGSYYRPNPRRLHEPKAQSQGELHRVGEGSDRHGPKPTRLKWLPKYTVPVDLHSPLPLQRRTKMTVRVGSPTLFDTGDLWKLASEVRAALGGGLGMGNPEPPREAGIKAGSDL